MAKHELRIKDLEPHSQGSDDQPDFIKTMEGTKTVSRAQSVPPKSRMTLIPTLRTGTASKDAGGIDEQQFQEAFGDYPRLDISSGNEVENEMMKISTVLSNPNEDWEKRIEQLLRLRGLVVAGATNYKEFTPTMKYMDLALQASVKDLRSQVVREACITLGFLAEKLGSRCDRTAEMTLPALILLIPNSVRIMASSGIVAIRFILMHVHFHKLIPIITREYLTSKSKEIRRACCEFVNLILTYFPKAALEKNVATIQEAIKKGISDADSEARALARQAFVGFSTHFPTHAQTIYKELDAAQKRQLDGEMTRSTSQSSIKSNGSVSGIPAPKARTAAKASDSIGVAAALRMGKDQVDTISRADYKGGRSASAIDVAAARRAKAKVVPNTRTIKPPTKAPATVGRSRPSPSSQSQPGSRSNSPSGGRFVLLQKRTPMSTTSRGTSRETSPTRSAFGKGLSIFQPGTQSRIYPSSQPRRFNDSMTLGSRKNSQDSSHSHPNHSDDESEASSMASEHSLGSIGRTRGTSAATIRQDLGDILNQLNSGNWTVKRDGLLGLQQYMARGGRPLSHSELETACLTFTRMMNDPVMKAIGTLLDVLFDFIRIHKLELGPWLHMFLTKLLSKQGAELIPTVQTRIDRLMGLIRTSFPADTQFQHILRYITDQTQIPNVRVKAAILNYLLNLIHNNMQAADLKNSSSSRVGITKLINWTLEGKTTEIKKSSQQVLIALNHLNTAEFIAMIDTLDECMHDAALKIISGQMMRRSSGFLEEQIRSPESTSSKKGTPTPSVSASTPINRLTRRSVPPLSSSTPPAAVLENEENLNPDAIFSTFRQTAQEIKKFDPSGRNGITPDRQRPLASQSSESINNDIAPYYDDHSVVPLYANHTEQSLYLTTLADRLARTPKEKQYTVLRHLHEYIPLVSEEVWGEHIMVVLPLLYEHFQNSQSELAAWALACFGQLLKLQPNRMRQYPELVIVNIIEVQKGASKAVVKAAEDCAFLAARIFSCDVIVKILIPIITNQPHPENAAAVKLYTFMVQQAPMEEVIPIIQSVVPLLVTAYADNDESNMRKECVYGLIYTQLKVGDELMARYLSKLPASKIRLMNLYLKRTVSHGQDSASPENTATSNARTNGDSAV